MRVAVNSHALPVHEKNGIVSLLCIFESTIIMILLTFIYIFEAIHYIVVSKMHSNEVILFFI